MKETVINKKVTYSIVAVLLIVLITIGATYAYFSAQAQTDIQTVTTGTLTMGFTNGEIINATGITPINDSEIETKATELPFSITNTGNQHMNITIKLTDITIDEALKDIDFRWGLYNPDKMDSAGTEMGLAFGIFKYSETGKEEIIYRDTIIDTGSAPKNYVLRIWLHDDGALQNEMQGKTFSAKVTVTGEAIEYTPESCFTFNRGTITNYDYATCGTDVVIPRTIGGTPVTTIASGVLEGTFDYDTQKRTDITSIIIPDSVTTIEGLVGGDNILSHVTIPDSLTTIPRFFSKVDSITIPESIRFSNNDDFSFCNARVLVIPGSFTVLSTGLFDYLDKNHQGLTDIVLMEGITTIGTKDGGVVFRDNSLTSIEIPKTVNAIPSDVAFAAATGLREIVIRGKSSFSDFTDSTGLAAEATLPEGCNIIFRP